ncbi:hypothetical protein K435DRAFT_852422 [Dendrothele bispora CBS 962.96]|uniref:peptidylprolyl isomerase n=1 Tax=Dendrothele bispora (strain CBS 962.96) TaxID=1314807 RepID=A0A4S8MJP6_DENBC|nr:hypothetical protein K435DRAFT_852422 [Dendrothele bispora CBS 962.96]
MSVRPRVFFDFTVDGQLLGRVIFELYNDTVPKTSENFRALCTGEKGRTASGAPLYYKNSIIHRSIKDFMIQGGDFTKRNGTGGESIYGGMFPDENLSRPLDSEALLCMANRGPDTNGSQFFITLRPCPHLNGKHVVFGRVLRGFEEVIQKIVDVPVDERDRPTVPVVVSNCGELELRKKPSQLPPKPTARSESVSDNEKHQSSRHRKSRRPRSRSPDSEDDSDRSEQRHRRKKHKKSKRERKEREASPHKDESEPKVNERGETEEEYDARLEREEKERVEAARKRELERIKRLHDKEAQKTDGVRFKGLLFSTSQ